MKNKILRGLVVLFGLSFCLIAQAENAEDFLVDPELLNELENLDRNHKIERAERKIDSVDLVGEDQIEKELDNWDGDEPLRKLAAPEPMPVESQEDAESSMLAQDIKKAPKKIRRQKLVSSVKQKNGFKPVKKKCAIREKANTEGKEVGFVTAGRRVWAEFLNQDWIKVYRRKGFGFISSDCVEDKK